MLIAKAAELLDAPLDEINLDFLHGVQGVVFYLLKRKKGGKVVQKYFEILQALSVKDDEHKDAIKWIFTNPLYDHSSYNLSLSHGIGSIIGLLTVAINSGFDTPQIYELQHKAVNYLEASRLDPDDYYAVFPSVVPIKEEGHNFSQMNSRLAWCYGDLGLGAALLSRGIATNDPKAISSAEEILLNCANRRSKFNTEVNDAGICHGAAGNALIFHKVNQTLNRPELVDARKFLVRKKSNV